VALAKTSKKKSKRSASTSKPQRPDDLSVLNALKNTQISRIRFKSADPSGKDCGLVKVLTQIPTAKTLKDDGIAIWPKEAISPAGVTFGFKNSLPVWVVHPREELSLKSDPQIEATGYGLYRDLAGDVLRACEQIDQDVLIDFDSNLQPLDLVGFFVGLELAAYRFKQAAIGDAKKNPFAKIFILENSKLSELKKAMAEAIKISGSTNISRHLVNMSGAQLTPKTFSKFVTQFFAKSKSIKVSVWGEKELIKNKCNLILAVGQSAIDKPNLVRITYKPKKTSIKTPIAFIGKGVTFDSGGLDIKPSSGMRLMKKDMAGAAALFGFANWLSQSDVSKPIEIFLSLAENAISDRSMRPGDVIVSKSGISVEIHNTDAEGRLVLADAMTVAKDLNCSPIIDVATLTGAIKVTLGGDVSGLFANDINLRASLSQAAKSAGEPTWEMPLVQSYRLKMRSTVADMQNAVDGFGGAVTAALFLQSFVGSTPWAHFDIYGWADGVTGALSEGGGNGQAVQTLINFIEHA